MKLPLLFFVGASTLLLTACNTTPYQNPYANLTAPTVVRPPDFSDLPTGSCRGGEYIYTFAHLALDKKGRVTKVVGLSGIDTKLAYAIGEQFQKALYTPYLQNGVPVARNLKVGLSLKCPNRY